MLEILPAQCVRQLIMHHMSSSIHDNIDSQRLNSICCTVIYGTRYTYKRETEQITAENNRHNRHNFMLLVARSRCPCTTRCHAINVYSITLSDCVLHATTINTAVHNSRVTTCPKLMHGLTNVNIYICVIHDELLEYMFTVSHYLSITSK